MVNVEKLLEKLNGLVFEEEGDIRLCRHAIVLWNEGTLREVATIPQLMGKINTLIPIGYYDEIYSKLDISIFQADKVKENLAKLGLRGKYDSDGDYDLKNGETFISKRCFEYIRNMQSIPRTKIVRRGELLYNDVLKASKEWKNEI